jgi:hypothetical protein
LLFGVLMAKWTSFSLVISIVGCTVIFGGVILQEKPKIKKPLESLEDNGFYCKR